MVGHMDRVEMKRWWQSRTIWSLYVGFGASAAVQFWGKDWQIIKDNQEAVVLVIVGIMALAGDMFRRKAKKGIGK